VKTIDDNDHNTETPLTLSKIAPASLGEPRLLR
jgi:hypothetical protein